MTYWTMKIQKNMKKKMKFRNRKNHERAVVHKFWNEAPEDILMEIFIRHPDFRSAARASTVCRLWRSLISRNPQFIDRFNSHHHQHLIPWTMMLRKLDLCEYPVPRPEHARTLCQLHSDEWMLVHGKLPVNCLDFLPSPMLIRADSCTDLLLVSPGLSCNDDMYICSPVTKQFVRLPSIPSPIEDTSIYEVVRKGYALVALPPSGATTNSRFKVVEVLQYCQNPILTALNPKPNCVVSFSLFCSESRKWEIRNFPVLGPRDIEHYRITSEIITCNGILYWLGGSCNSNTLVYFDLSKDKFGVIDIPSGIITFTLRIGIVHAGGGVHELRLIQVLISNKPEIIHLRVWRLNTNDNHSNNNNDEEEHEDDDSKWFLVHDKKLKIPKNLRREWPFMGPFLHPTNGDFLFIVWGKSVIEYNLTDATPKKIAEIIELSYRLDVTPFVMVLSSTASNLASSYL